MDLEAEEAAPGCLWWGVLLAEHVAQGQEELVHQDLAVIRRSVGNIADDTNETQSAIWEGVREGLDDCTQ
ncbi:MAG: hypothetical protein ABWX92_04095 [Mycetocola sp.]